MNAGDGRADGIDLRLMRYFLTVAEELHFTRAARRLFVSQPALSNQIQRLEAALGVQLFTRTNRGVMLTAAGQAFLPHAQRSVAALRAGVAAVAPEVLLRVDVLDAELALPRTVLARLRAAHTDARIDVTAEGSVSQRRRLLAGDLDAGFCGRGAADHEDLAAQLICHEPVDIVVPEDHRLARNGHSAFADLADEVFYLPHDDLAPEWNDFVRSACQESGFEPIRHRIATGSAASALELVAEGSCITLSLRSTSLPDGTVRLRPVPALAYPWVLVWHRDRDADAGIRWLREAAHAHSSRDGVPRSGPASL
jgi:DNA-binding transcriptional LysR family regulator